MTGTLHANLDIWGSGSEAPGHELILERFALGVSKYVVTSANIALGARDIMQGIYLILIIIKKEKERKSFL